MPEKCYVLIDNSGKVPKLIYAQDVAFAHHKIPMFTDVDSAIEGSQRWFGWCDEISIGEINIVAKVRREVKTEITVERILKCKLN